MTYYEKLLKNLNGDEKKAKEITDVYCPDMHFAQYVPLFICIRNCKECWNQEAKEG